MSAPAPDPREHVGPYRLIRAIGAGGSARIDLARIDRAYSFQRHVVIKRPLEHLRADPQVAASLRREARIGGRLRHPNLVSVLDAGTHDSYDFLALEYVHGASLRTLMQTEVAGQVRDVPLEVALGIVTDVARGLHDAHELTDEHGAPLGLVHRDVSPGNVLLGLDGAVKVSDFGIAKETRVATLSGSMHGTVTYMAPEQCRGHAFDRRADLFSLGVILYELVTHVRLFWADNDVASLHRVLSGQVTRPRRLVATLSPALEEIVMTAVAHDPDRRFATARALAEALEGLAATEGHVLGARMIARAVEDVVGARQAPWIAATTHVDPPRERSLVEVISSLEDDEPANPTFGASDAHAIEEGPAPSPSPPPPAPRRSRVPLYVAAALSTVGIAAIVTFSHHTSSPQPLPAPVTTPAPAAVTVPAAAPAPAAVTAPAPAAVTAPVTVPVPDPVPVPAPVPAPAPVAVPAPGPTRAPSHHHHQTSASHPESTPSQPAPPTPPATGSAAAPPAATPEWNPTILLPTDRGSGHHQ